MDRIKLRDLREREGYSITRLAKAAHVSRSHLTNVEAGRRDLSPDALDRVADVLGVRSDALRS